MSESVVADFVATFDSDVTTRPEPIKGRVLLSKKRLVLAANNEDKLSIPLSRLLDVAVGHVPEELSGFFQSTVTVAFMRNGGEHVAVVEAPDEKIQKFCDVLFKASLNGTQMTVKHPALVGGRVTDEEFEPAKLVVKPQLVTFTQSDRTIEIPLSSVTEFSRSNRRIAGSSRPVLEVRHMHDGQSMLTMAVTDSGRKMSILGRYLRLEYSNLMSELDDVELTGDKKEILVALYSGAGTEGVSLAQIVDIEPSQLTILLNRLEEDELVADSEDGTKLTPKGQVVVSKHLEDVNA